MFDDPKFTIETERLILRPPRQSDFPAFETMSQDEETMRHIGGVEVPAIAWRRMAMSAGHWYLHGFGFFSVIEKASGKWIGRIGPHNPHLWPEPEVGWVIARPHWHQGFAREATIASTSWTFVNLGWKQVTHVIAPDNIASQMLARSIGSVPIREIDELPGFGAMKLVIWGQSAADWAKNHSPNSAFK